MLCNAKSNRINSFVKSPLHYLYMFIPSLATSMTHYNPALQSLFERLFDE